jgi:hypothetical protein
MRMAVAFFIQRDFHSEFPPLVGTLTMGHPRLQDRIRQWASLRAQSELPLSAWNGPDQAKPYQRTVKLAGRANRYHR